MITDRDRKIIRHIEQYKYATLEQIEKIFFKQQKNSYNIARRRMAEIRKAGYVKVNRDIETNRLVYMWDDGKTKMPGTHRLILLDVLANLHYNGFTVQQFEIEKAWQGGAIRSDAFTVFTLENVMNRYQYFIEVHLSNNPHNLEKYDRLLATTEVQDYLGRNINPRVLLVSDRNHEATLKRTQVVTLNTKLDAFASVILPEQSFRSTPSPFLSESRKPMIPIRKDV